MAEQYNPVNVERKMAELASRITASVPIRDERYRAMLDTARAYDRAYCAAYLEARGSIKDKEAVAKLEAMPEREAKEVAEAAYRYADTQAKALSEELRAMQSIGVSVREAYRTAGRGEF